jgi:hypothetical protein
MFGAGTVSQGPDKGERTEPAKQYRQLLQRPEVRDIADIRERVFSAGDLTSPGYVDKAQEAYTQSMAAKAAEVAKRKREEDEKKRREEQRKIKGAFDFGVAADALTATSSSAPSPTSPQLSTSPALRLAYRAFRAEEEKEEKEAFAPVESAYSFRRSDGEIVSIDESSEEAPGEYGSAYMEKKEDDTD